LLVIGLGNPGAEYRETRHNLGFMVVDALASSGGNWKRVCKSKVRRGNRLTLVKPQTYMNRSGEAVECLLRAENVRKDELLVVCDDVNLPFGELRLKPSGGAGGHNGLTDVIAGIGEGFGRLRIGCGPAPRYADLADFVLSPFTPAENNELPSIIERAAAACLLLERLGYQRAMSEVNQRLDKSETDQDTGDPTA
jgi:PTH1 family peptidyl-tRNA hydrolase